MTPCAIPKCKYEGGKSLLCSEHYHRLPPAIRNVMRHASPERLKVLVDEASDYIIKRKAYIATLTAHNGDHLTERRS